MDARTLPPDTCPLCKQRALSLEEGVLRCTHCQAEAQLDAATRQVRYTLIPKPYAQFEDALKDKWLTRRATFEATELKPLPTVVFFPIIVSLLALCALFGLIGIVLAVRPGMGTTRQIIDEAYAKQNGLALPGVTSLTPTLITTLDVSLTVTVSDFLTATVEVTNDVAPTSTLPPLPVPNTPPVQPPTPLPTLLQPPPIPTRPPTFTPIPALPTVLPSPTVQVAPTVLPTPTPTTLPALNSPQPTPLATRTSTPTPTPGQGTVTATPTPTATGPVSQTGAVIVSGISSTVAISNVRYFGTPGSNETDEYVDLFNRGTTVMNLSDWKLKVGQTTYPLPNNLQVVAGLGCRIYTGVPPNTEPPAPFNGCARYSFNVTTSLTGIWPNATNVGNRVELLDAANVMVAYFGY